MAKIYLDIGVNVALRFLLSWAKWGADWFLDKIYDDKHKRNPAEISVKSTDLLQI